MTYQRHKRQKYQSNWGYYNTTKKGGDSSADNPVNIIYDPTLTYQSTKFTCKPCIIIWSMHLHKTAKHIDIMWLAQWSLTLIDTIQADIPYCGCNLISDSCVRFVQTQSLKKSFHDSKLPSFHLISSCNIATNVSLMRKRECYKGWWEKENVIKVFNIIM